MCVWGGRLERPPLKEEREMVLMKRLLSAALASLVAIITATLLLAPGWVNGSDQTLVHAPTFMSYAIPIMVLGLIVLGALTFAFGLALGARTIYLRLRSGG